MRDKQVATFLQGWPGFVRGVISSGKPNVPTSLSEVLETGEIDLRYFLSATAAMGILRRAERRSKTLPAALEAALLAVAGQTTPTGPERSLPDAAAAMMEPKE